MGRLAEKQAEVAYLGERLARANSLVLADLRGLSMAQQNQLRKKLREAGVEMRVSKNTLIRRAANQQGVQGLEPHLTGPTAIAFGYQDPAAPAKLLTDFAKANKQLAVKAGWLQGRVLDEAGVKSLAELPPREVLLAQLLAAIQAPLAQLVGAVDAPARQVVLSLEAAADKLGRTA